MKVSLVADWRIEKKIPDYAALVSPDAVVGLAAIFHVMTATYIFSAAYIGLVIGYLILNSDDYECRVGQIFNLLKKFD